LRSGGNGNGARGSAAVTESEFRGPSPAANLVQVDARELAALRKLRDEAAEFLTKACNEQISLPLDLAWSLAEVSDAVTAADEYDNA
jgi:hypothetical protein